MSSFLNAPFLRLMRGRLRQVESYSRNAGSIQRAQLEYLLRAGARTEYGQRYGFERIGSEEAFRNTVPVIGYEALQPYVERLMKGEDFLLWPEKIRWFAKSSGTTNSKSKYIPVSRQALYQCHYKGGKDLFALYLKDHPRSGIFSGKNVSLGGSLHPAPWGKASCGDVSAIITKNLPLWAEARRSPSKKISLMDGWEKKLDRMARSTLKQDIRSFLGVPSWMMLFLQKTLEISGKGSLREIWPDMELFVHGGVSFTPYRQQFEQLMGQPFSYLETYNASEGFFGIQDDLSQPDMLLMLDYGVYYEFMPLEESGKEHPQTAGIEEVLPGKNYALVITTNAGLWRYLIGDTVVFTSVRPYRFRISGRTRHFINTFGEELMVENADQALMRACLETGAEIADYTAAPVFLDAKNQARHQWLVEFRKEPESMEAFALALDKHLKEANSDYEAKRSDGLLLKAPQVIPLPAGTFFRWLQGKGKLGGQHKIPRLSNQRDFVRELLALCGETSPEP